MKRLFALALVLPLLFSCKFDMEDMFKVSPTIKGYSYSFESKTLNDEDAAKALEAVIITKSKWEGKKGDKCDFQVQLMGDKYGGTPDKLEIYYFQKGNVTYESANSVTININGDYKAINGTWELTREDSGDKITLVSGGQTLKMKFWHETD